jgi:transcription antitermination factor NusG
MNWSEKIHSNEGLSSQLPQEVLHWYAVYTKPRHEKKVVENLNIQNIEVYAPLVKKCRQWSDRKKWVEEPLIKGYVFVHICPENSLYVLETPGVVRFVMFSGEYAVIPDFQIIALQKTIESKYPIQPTQYLKIGEYVEVINGPLKGIIGKVQRAEGKTKFVISLDTIQSSFSVEIDSSYLRALPEDKKKKIFSPPLGI